MKLTNQQILDKFRLTDNEFDVYKWDIYNLRRGHHLNKQAAKYDASRLHSFHSDELFNFCWTRV